VAYVLAIDIGGTKIEVGLVDREGDILVRSRISSRFEHGEDLFEQVVILAGQVIDGSGVRPDVVGVGCGGPMRIGGAEVSPLNIPAWSGFPLRSRLGGHFGLPAFVDNDAKALALAEGWLGAAIGVRDYLAMVVSTGIGAGIVLDGRLLDGEEGNAGHIGHVVVEPGGPRCACGVSGCLEALASGTALATELGHPPAQASIEIRERTGRYVGRAVATAVNLLDLRLAVVAGSVALGFGEPFFTAANEELAVGCGLEFTMGARIVPAGLGGDGPLVGAAAVGLRGLGALGEAQ
jgi:glucokinase